MNTNAEQAQGNRVLVLGVGNRLLRDDGIGVHVVERLRQNPDRNPAVSFLDGGTLGLTLLPEIEASDSLIVVDAGALGVAAGDVQVFEGAAMDRQLCGRKSTVHEVAVADLLAAASMSGHAPRRRALVAIQPADTTWGLTPTAAVAAAVPRACGVVEDLASRWAQ